MGLKDRFKFKGFNFKPNFKGVKPPNLNFSLKWLLILLIIMVMVGGVIFYLNYDPLTPEEAVAQAIDSTLNAESYRYKAISKRLVNGQESVLSEVLGEKSGDNVHFVGQLHVVNSQFEYYQVGEQIYRKDAFSSSWLVVDDVNIEVTEKLIQEINPLGSFALQGPLAVEYLGKEKIENKKHKKYAVSAATENKYLEILWQDFSYTIWVDSKGVMKKAEIKAESKQAEGSYLIMAVEFFDYNQEIVINPPL